MTAPFPPRLLPVLVALLPALAAAEDSFRCQRGIVSIGDLKVDLLGKCGEPTLREGIWSDEVTTSRAPGASGAPGLRTSAPIERWTYDLGSSQFIEVVTIEGGRIRAIDRGGRGYADSGAGAARPALPIARCDPRKIRVGDTSYELLSRCGAPASRDLRLTTRVIEQVTGGMVVRNSVNVSIEVWTFHYGPQTQTRVVELEDGKVVRIETGSHGYSP